MTVLTSDENLKIGQIFIKSYFPGTSAQNSVWPASCCLRSDWHWFVLYRWGIDIPQFWRYLDRYLYFRVLHCRAACLILGINATTCFPVFMSSCALLMPACSIEFIKTHRYDVPHTIGNAIGGLSEWKNEKGWLIDTCLDGQDNFTRLLDMLGIAY